MTAIFTMAALAQKTVPELRALFRESTRQLAASDAGTEQRRTALANLNAIERALAANYMSGP